MKPLTGGPDAYRYLTLGSGKPVSRPFHLRWLLPYFLTTSPRAWWSVFLASWPVAAFGFIAWRVAAGDPWQVALAGAVLLLGLPGILGPKAVIPVVLDAIHYLPQVKQPARLLVHHEDARVLREYLAEELKEQGWQVVEDSSIERGGCLVETAENQIDATNAMRWKRLTQGLSRYDDWHQPLVHSDES